MLVTVLHYWLPVLSVLGLSVALAPCIGGVQYSPLGAMALGFGVLGVYTGDRLIEPGRVPGRLKVALWSIACLAGGAVLMCTWFAPRRLLPIEALLGLLSLSYGLAKRHPVTKTVSLTAAWWIGCTLLPFELWLQEAEAWGVLCSAPALSMALTVAAAAIMCDYKDLERDREAGWSSIPVRLGVRRTHFLTNAMALVAAWLAAAAGGTALWLCAFLMLVLGSMVKVLSRPLLGPVLVDAALALPGLLLWLYGLWNSANGLP